MPLTNDNSLDYYGNDNPVCPHCDHVESDDLEDLWEEGEHFIDCPNCEKEFKVTTNVRITFNTDCQEGDE